MASVFDVFLSREARLSIASTQEVLINLKGSHILKPSLQFEKIVKKHFYINKNQRLNAGYIIRRPLENFKKGQYFDLFHYGIFLGVDIIDNRLVLDMTKENNVSIRTLEDFLGIYSIAELEIIGNPEKTSMKKILRRADRAASGIYSKESNDCEHFAVYCLNGRHESRGLQNCANGAVIALDILTKLLDFQIMSTPNHHSQILLSDLNGKYKSLTNSIKNLK
jgi:hypothetical protein